MNINRKYAYGVSSKFDFGQWNHRVVGPFFTEDAAFKWLHREEYDFRERELMSKTAAIRLVGKAEFDRQTAVEREW